MTLELILCLKQLPSHSKINKLTIKLILFSWNQKEHGKLREYEDVWMSGG